jgi:hypothetical protein
LEENPWDVFETIYTEGSIHQGTVVSLNDKGGIINLLGAEGFAFNKGLLRADGSYIKIGETEDMKVLEFSKENKRIVLSHAKIWQDARDAERERENAEEMSEGKKKGTKRVVDNSEKSTLGDLDALVSLKADLEIAENKSKKKKTAKQKVEIDELQVEEAQPTTEEPQEVIEEPQAITEEIPTEVEPPQEIVEETQTLFEDIQIAVEEPQPAIEDVQPVAEEPQAEVEYPEIKFEDAEPAAVEEVVEKPKRTRAKKVKEEATTEVAIETVAEEKPKKTRAKKVKEEATAEAEAEEKPKKTRTKKSEKKTEEVEKPAEE